MKKFLLFTLLVVVMTTCHSCVATQTFEVTDSPYDLDNNIVIRRNVCYIYYPKPTMQFLNSLHVNNGAFYYWYGNKYIPVVFPQWKVWSPHRFFYHDMNGWNWRDRYRYNHEAYRRKQHWYDYRRPYNPRQNPNFNNRGRQSIHPTYNRPSSKRIMTRQPNRRINSRRGR